MPAAECPNCGSVETQARLQDLQCRSCGQLFGFDGEKRDSGPDQTVRDRMEAALQPRATPTMGNLNNLILAGGEAGVNDPEVRRRAQTPDVVGPIEFAKSEGIDLELSGDLVTTSSSGVSSSAEGREASEQNEPTPRKRGSSRS